MRCASKLLPALLLGFRNEYPHVPLFINQHDGETNTQQSSGIQIFQNHHPLTDDNCIKLLEEEVFLVMPRNHPLAGSRTLSPADIAQEEFITLSHRKKFRRSIDEYCMQAGISLNIMLESDDPATIRSLIHHGFGFSFMPKYTWGDINDPAIAHVHISGSSFVRYIYLSWKKDNYLAQSAKHFIKYVISFFNDVRDGRISF